MRASLAAGSAVRERLGSLTSLRVGTEGAEFYQPLYRVHGWVRGGFVLHMAVLMLARWHELRSPALAVVALVVVGAWTTLSGIQYIQVAGRLGPWLIADVAVTLALVLASPWASGVTNDVGTTLVGLWIASAPLAVAIRYGAVLGGLSSLPLAAAGYWLARSGAADVWGSAIVLVTAAIGVGWFVERFRSSTRERHAYFATAAALGERERLNRIVHDGVLQVLAMVEREGRGLGPRGEQLARAAREQENSLRALLQDKDVDVTVGDLVEPGRRNLTTLLDRHESEKVSIATLADDVLLPTARAEELDAVVSEVLSNVTKHAGPDAKAWVLLEREDDELILSIRDDGVGASASEINGAGERGHFGVQDSIYGRIRDLGGTAQLRAARGRGVEWEFRVPVE